MQDKIREIIAVFIRTPAAEIVPSTPVDRPAIGNSILLHRMYAKLAENGIVIADYASVKNFSDLLRQAGAPSSAQAMSGSVPVELPGGKGIGSAVTAVPAGMVFPGNEGGVGIDMQEITELPKTHDFRREEFYKMNFGPSEIAYCILQPDPYASFAGLFAAKEAIVKANGLYRNRSFDTIGIGHSAEGRPVHTGFDLSISHTGNMAVAVAVASDAGPSRQGAVPEQIPAPAAGTGPAFWLALLALLLSGITLLIFFTQRTRW